MFKKNRTLWSKDIIFILRVEYSLVVDKDLLFVLSKKKGITKKMLNHAYMCYSK